MSVLIVSATNMEIIPFRNQYPDAEVLISGVGVPAVLYAITKKIISGSYNLIIQAGIAGTFDEELEPGKNVLVYKDRFSDIGMMENGKFSSVFESGFADADLFPFQDAWLRNDINLSEYSDATIVNGLTVNMVSDVIIPYGFSLKNTIETMEGAALHYVCKMENIPFIQLRNISNRAGDRNKQNWKIKDSVENLNAELISMYKKIKKCN